MGLIVIKTKPDDMQLLWDSANVSTESVDTVNEKNLIESVKDCWGGGEN